ncbi:TRAP transporter small permease (plasmid) [Rhizobium sp. 32-5/1]|uniref:TRAP transporter small permease n=1 Tax=Rhizobium sp. 32-5/1 TaxID=3019602 RepID=UPI00240E549D|nr:TRAP transporter small permease [Rhizobium sp. 32-5/1]WEZ85921.1 TRAP transporter small permease [Rhizobium sp. 32-5/1]
MTARAIIDWLKARADDVAAALLAAMFIAFLLQIVTRYVFNNPLGWTQEVCLTTWLWLVFWGSAFSVRDRDEVRFDLLYHSVSAGMRRKFALVSAVALTAGFAASFPASLDYIMFYKIKKSAMLGIRLDVVFSVYAIFALAVIMRGALQVVHILRGGAIEEAAEARDA